MPIFAGVFAHAASRPKGFHATLTQIDPIQVWIYAERRLMRA
jgi:hypothetical protein